MISFYPGPSRVEECIPEYVQDAFSQGVLSINHRSDSFMELAKNTIDELKVKLNVPKDYTVLFASSATECWEIIGQSLIKNKSYHVFNGAFGEKWQTHTHRITSQTVSHSFDTNNELSVDDFQVSEQIGTICITQNETSNGTQIQNQQIKDLRHRFPEQLIAVDATSSMAGIHLDFINADVWYASVQKCFGLPAGLAVMICSPKAIERAFEIDDFNRYNSLPSIIRMMKKYQTTHTPNVMGIYLLNRVMQSRQSIDIVHQQTMSRYSKISSSLQEVGLKHLIDNETVRSYTVLPVAGDVETISRIKSEARNEGITLGNGYGKLKESTFRIANFPAITDHEIEVLASFFKRYK